MRKDGLQLEINSVRALVDRVTRAYEGLVADFNFFANVGYSGIAHCDDCTTRSFSGVTALFTLRRLKVRFLLNPANGAGVYTPTPGEVWFTAPEAVRLSPVFLRNELVSVLLDCALTAALRMRALNLSFCEITNRTATYQEYIRECDLGQYWVKRNIMIPFQTGPVTRSTVAPAPSIAPANMIEVESTNRTSFPIGGALGGYRFNASSSFNFEHMVPMSIVNNSEGVLKIVTLYRASTALNQSEIRSAVQNITTEEALAFSEPPSSIESDPSDTLPNWAIAAIASGGAAAVVLLSVIALLVFRSFRHRQSVPAQFDLKPVTLTQSDSTVSQQS